MTDCQWRQQARCQLSDITDDQGQIGPEQWSLHPAGLSAIVWHLLRMLVTPISLPAAPRVLFHGRGLTPSSISRSVALRGVSCASNWPDDCFDLNVFDGVQQFASGWDSSSADSGSLASIPLHAPRLVPTSVRTWDAFQEHNQMFWQRNKKCKRADDPRPVRIGAVADVILKVHRGAICPVDRWLVPLDVQSRGGLSAQQARI